MAGSRPIPGRVDREHFRCAERLRGRSAELDRGVDQAFEKVRRRQTNLSDCDSAQSVARENSSGTKRSAAARLSPRNRALSAGGAGPYLYPGLVCASVPARSTAPDRNGNFRLAIDSNERRGTLRRDTRAQRSRAKDGMDNAAGLLAGFLVLALSLAIYFIPTLVAFERLRRNRGAIFVLNLFLGWTLVGWVAALVWAWMNPVTAMAPLETEGRAPCPHCREQIIVTARLCRFCGRELAADWSRPLVPHRRAW